MRQEILKGNTHFKRWIGHVARMEEGRNGFKILAGIPSGKKYLERPRRRWEDNIGMDLKK